jgi:hypothetical protein
MSELQQTLIKDDQYIPRVKSDSKNDPCVSAKATASSVSAGEIFRTAKGEIGDLLPLNVARAADISYSETHGDVESVYVKLASDLDTPTTVKLYVQYIGGDSDTFANAGKIYETEAVVPPTCESWVKFNVNIPTKRDMYVEKVRLRFMLDENPGISWRSIVNGTMYQTAGEKDENGNWNMKACCSMCASVTEPKEPIADCGPQNAINGYNRIVDADHYEWVSDPAQEMPQWLEVEFKQPTAINNVSVCFDTDLVNPGVAWGVKVAEPPKCIKDYNIEIFDGRSWIKIAEEKNNFMRKRSHRFETTTVEKLRVTALATWGDRSARIMEIRADNVLGIS